MKFFFTTHYPHRWTSGPSIHFHNPDKGYRPISSLEEAEELARTHAFESHSDDRIVTTFGVIHGEF